MNYNYLLGANLCIQQSVKLMRKLGIEQGQIININSNCGHRVYSAPGMRYSLPPFQLKMLHIEPKSLIKLVLIKSNAIKISESITITNLFFS